MANPLAVVAGRLQADLRTRFPGIAVRFVEDEEGGWTCRVEDGPACWGESGTWVDDRDDLTPDDIEQLLLDITSNVADNLWPDELTAPWPPCPRHRDHPLQPQLRGRLAAWTCLRDDSVSVPIGGLRG